MLIPAGPLDLLALTPLCVCNTNGGLGLQPPSDCPIQDPVQGQSGSLGRLRTLSRF
jgi:hypothetical protein